MSESSNLYRGVVKKEKNINFAQEQNSVCIKDKGWQFLFQQVENKLKERRSLKSIEFRRLCKERVNRFRNLRSIDSDFKVSHFHKVCRHIVTIAKIDFREKIFLASGVKYLYVLGILGTISPNWILTGSVLKKLSLFNWIGINIFYLGAIIILFFLISSYLKLYSPFKSFKYGEIMGTLFSLPIAAIVCFLMSRAFIMQHADDSFFAMFPLVTTIGSTFSVLIFIFLAEVTWIISMFLQPKSIYSYTDSILVNGLLEVLAEIEKESLWPYRVFRETIWRKIKVLGQDLQYSYKGGQTFKGIGYSLYAYESWLDDPKAHTYEDLKVRITEKLKHAIPGHLGEIEKSYPKGLSLKQMLQKSVAFLPILCFLGLMLAPSLFQMVKGTSLLDPVTYRNILDYVYLMLVLLFSVPLLKYVDKESLKKILELITIFLPVKKE